MNWRFLFGAAFVGCSAPVVSGSTTGSGSSAASNSSSSTSSASSVSSSSSASSSTSSSSASSSSSSSSSASSSSASSASSSSSSSSSGSGSSTGSPGVDAGHFADVDQDGLDDAWEDQLAQDYLPWISLHPQEACAQPDGLVVRVSPHPADPTRPPRFVEIRYDHLYASDCGLSGHVGDDENFAITVDTSLPPPAGIMVIKAISHRNTTCEHVSYCVQQAWSQSPCSGYARCDTPAAGAPRAGFPMVYVSKNKHGDYTTTAGCTLGCDFGACSQATVPELPAVLNVGEPGHPRVSNLTTQGFITTANGWTDATLHDVDPWGAAPFGGAGTIAADLTDAALDPPICQ